MGNRYGSLKSGDGGGVVRSPDDTDEGDVDRVECVEVEEEDETVRWGERDNLSEGMTELQPLLVGTRFVKLTGFLRASLSRTGDASGWIVTGVVGDRDCAG